MKWEETWAEKDFFLFQKETKERSAVCVHTCTSTLLDSGVSNDMTGTLAAILQP